MTAAAANIGPGDRVWWRYEARGGYGYAWDVPAVVVALTPKRVRIRAQLTAGGAKLVAVRADRLKPRTTTEDIDRETTT